MTIEDLRALLAEPDVAASHGAVWNPLALHGLTVKKKTAHASEQERSDGEAAREIWRQMQRGLDPEKLVFLFAKLKALLPKAAKRTVDDLWQAIGDTLDQFTSRECRNDLQKARYAST